MSDERKRKARKFTNGRGEGRGDGYAGTNLTSWTYRDGTPGRNHVDAKSLATGPTVYLRDPDVTLWHGEVLDALQKLPDESVHCVVTSPPYFGLRDYGTGAWAGGDPNCDHKRIGRVMHAGRQGNAYGTPPGAGRIGDEYYSDVCGKCGAQRTDQQLGLEPTPDAYIERMVAVFREVRRVLRRDGTCWLNIGDSYVSQGGVGRAGFNGGVRVDQASKDQRLTPEVTGLKTKDLAGMPWKLAFALQADGWWLRADIIWAKPNPMPESVTDRPTKAHEYVFLLTRSPRYFFDQEAVREPLRLGSPIWGEAESNWPGWSGNPNVNGEKGHAVPANPAGRNVRSVWTIATEPYPEAHFATFPTELARRCILAGTSERGCCPECGAPWVREVEREPNPNGITGGEHREVVRDGGLGTRVRDLERERRIGRNETVGWRPSCECSLATSLTTPCTVLDPFVGSGTVPHVARLHNRHAIGIDLNAEYLELAARRLQQQSLFASSSTEGAV